ncbi:MAG: 50S ribosomal protein L13, partial [bacterium]
TYTDFVDCGDFVVVTNAKSLRLSGNKMESKFYFSHSGYAGGAKTTPIRRMMEKDPTKVVYLAVKRMLPDNRLRGAQLRRLRIYAEAAKP